MMKLISLLIWGCGLLLFGYGFVMDIWLEWAKFPELTARGLWLLHPVDMFVNYGCMMGGFAVMVAAYLAWPLGKKM